MNKDFFSDKNNDFFSYFRGLDLQELLMLIENTYLEYRKKLDLPNEVTFGIEIEYENFKKSRVDSFILKKFPKWESSYDASLLKGGEIISPILSDKIARWSELEDICNFLKFHRINTMGNASGHIHVGAHLLGKNVDNWKTFIKLYMLYEPIINRFSYGDKINAREKILKYAEKQNLYLYEKLENVKRAENLREIFACLTLDKFTSVNFLHIRTAYLDQIYKGNTIEFRSPNATTSPIIIQNNVNLFTKMLLSCQKDVIDVDFLDYNLEKCFNDYLYPRIHIKHALEFSDMVFDNNLDKLYFLRQYFKDFGEVENTEIIDAHFIKTKKFTK